MQTSWRRIQRKDDTLRCPRVLQAQWFHVNESKQHKFDPMGNSLECSPDTPSVPGSIGQESTGYGRYVTGVSRTWAYDAEKPIAKLRDSALHREG